MASPQRENGHIDIANEIAEALMKIQLTGYQYRVLWGVWRKTYGWNKKEDIISVSQLTKMTGLKHGHISRALKELRDRNIITRTSNGTSRQKVTISFQKDYEKWRLVPSQVQGKLVPSQVHTRTNPGTKLVPSQGNTKEKNTTNKRKTKEYPIILPEFLDEDMWGEIKRYRIKVKAPMTNYGEYLFIRKITHLVSKGYKSNHLIITMMDRGWKTVFDPGGE